MKASLIRAPSSTGVFVPRVSLPRVVRMVVAPKATTMAEPVSIPVKKLDGSDAGSASLSLKVASDESATHVVHRYLQYFRDGNRAGTANTKTRSEIRGGGKKPYAQKGTGNARRGTNRSPLMPGGAVLFGPKPRDWSIDMNKKERRLAMATALQSATKSIVVVDSFATMEGHKTKTLVGTLQTLGADPMAHKILLVTKDSNEQVRLAGRNIEHLIVATLSSLNIYDLLRAKKIVIEKEALGYLQEFYSS